MEVGKMKKEERWRGGITENAFIPGYHLAKICQTQRPGDHYNDLAAPEVMRLLTHNFLHSTSSALPNPEAGYPLSLSVSAYKVEDTEAEQSMLEGVWGRINWECLRGAIEGVGKSSEGGKEGVEEGD